MIQALSRMWWPALAVMLLAAGCAHHAGNSAPPPNFSYYHAQDFAWAPVTRVVILPLVNETAHPEASDQLQRSLHASFQQMGLFEVVSVPPPLAARLARQVREAGRFDEAEVINLARCTGANVVIAGTLSHYTPYFRPRIGLTLQAISPDLGRVVGSADGLWDANDPHVACRARLFFVPKKSHLQKLCDYARWAVDDAYAADLVLESPHLFGQFVCGEAARLLVADPALMEGLLLTGEAAMSGKGTRVPCPPATSNCGGPANGPPTR